MEAGTQLPVILVGAVLAVALLYAARDPAHRVILSAARGARDALRGWSSSLRGVHEGLLRRNREVLLASGRGHLERSLEREFDRVHAVVAKDLAGYPALHRQISEHLTHIDEDYRQSAEVPPTPPAWTHAVEAVAQIPARENPVVADILSDIHETLQKGLEGATGAHRKAVGKRHRLLAKALPHWRRLSGVLERVGRQVTGLDERSRQIDHQMDLYGQIRSQADPAERLLSSSSLTQFFTSGLVMAIALMGAFINFNLIALPMSEMVGGGSYIGSLKTSDVAALVIILLEISMGVFLMEALRITRLFPVVGLLEDKMRRKMAWAAFLLLLILAAVESSLAYMRDLLAADREALSSQLAGDAGSPAEFRWIPAVGQMVMGFTLPFVLTFVAIPFESFIHSSRTVLGVVMAGLVRFFAFLLGALGGIAFSLGETLTALYDIPIFVPLKVEGLLRKSKTPSAARDSARPAAPDAPAAEGGGGWHT